MNMVEVRVVVFVFLNNDYLGYNLLPSKKRRNCHETFRNGQEHFQNHVHVHASKLVFRTVVINIIKRLEKRIQSLETVMVTFEK